MSWRLVAVFVALLLLSACAGGIIADVPVNPDPSMKYIFYMHGSVEEEEGAGGKYRMAVNAISSGSAVVISEVRGPTNPNTYAAKVQKQINALISKGVKPSNITVSGFSKGSIIALAVSGLVKNPEVNYVFLAGCSDFLNEKYGVHPHMAVGRILSIHDSDDVDFSSCSGLISQSDKVIFNEIELFTGKGHKLFRIPKEKFIQEWRDPLLDWAGA